MSGNGSVTDNAGATSGISRLLLFDKIAFQLFLCRWQCFQHNHGALAAGYVTRPIVHQCRRFGEQIAACVGSFGLSLSR